MNDTRTKILDIAEDLIQSVGVNAMSYKHISDMVGIRKASIHHHFPKKDDLVNALLNRCQTTYGADYSSIVEGAGTAPEKLRKLAEIFKDGLCNDKLCLVGSISTDRNTLQNSSCVILQDNIESTVEIFSTVFVQGQKENSLKLTTTPEEAAYAFFSFLVGNQIVARANGGADMFAKASQVFINSMVS